jgi:hypothetical protein
LGKDQNSSTLPVTAICYNHNICSLSYNRRRKYIIKAAEKTKNTPLQRFYLAVPFVLLLKCPVTKV